MINEINQNDKDREYNLTSFGLTIIRFTNDEVLYNTEMVLIKIENTIKELIIINAMSDIEEHF